MTNFWKNLPKPFFVLAPMYEVTDVVFREYVADYGKPDVMYTEFVPTGGLLSEEGRKHLVRFLEYTPKQRPIVAQLFGGKPEEFEPAARMLAQMGFDGIDINTGCPQRNIIKQGAGSDLIRDPERTKAIIQATKAGAGNVPVSVKVRIGFHTIETQRWIGDVLSAKPDAIIVHGRTQKEMSKVDAHWDEIGKAVEMARGTGIPIIGNGDVESREQGRELSQKYGVDGIMIGRGVFGNPWVFRENETSRTQEEKIVAVLDLAERFDKRWGRTKNFEIMKRHFKAYIDGFPGAKKLREELMEAKNLKDVRSRLN